MATGKREPIARSKKIATFTPIILKTQLMPYLNTLSKKLLTTLLLAIVSATTIHSQTIDWATGLDETFVFEISNKEALKLLQSNSGEGLVLKMLHSPIGSFTKTWANKPRQGHFVFANIYKNRINYHYAPVMPFQVFLFKEYGVLTLQVVDDKGAIRSNAKVKLGRSRVYYDPVSQTYTVNDESNKQRRILTVELDGFQAIFDLEKHFVDPRWNDWDRDDDRPEFYSYLLTDKNKYKPGETVRFKSYALTGGRRPIKENLQIWMRTSNRNYTFKQIGTVSPHHPGGFAGEIHLHDSLKLVLDQNYTFHLRDKSGRFVASTYFRYEDYELYDSKLEIKLATQQHYSPNTNKLEIAATDANGLFLPDLKADVTIKRRAVLNAYADVLILHDTLFNQRIDLDASAPTVVDIPASLFDASDCSYEVSVLAFSVDNQRMEKTANAVFYSSSHDLICTASGNKVRFSFFELGVEKKVEAELSYDDGRDAKRIFLPYEEKFNQTLSGYTIKVLNPAYTKKIPADRISSGLELKGGIVDGNLELSLSNPRELEMSWYVYEGNILIQKGAGKEFDFETHRNIDAKKTYYVEIFYFIGGEQKTFRRTYTANPQHLRVDVDLPERIYPGQTVSSTVKVSDYTGRAVPKVDLTAFAYNSLLNYYVPDLPYFGDSPEAREQRASYSMSRKAYAYSAPLDYDYWNGRAGLDKLEYYRFTYPKERLFTYAVNTPDSTTQFAPYVMKGGEEVKVWVIERNDRPVYYAWTEQPQAYSFLAAGDRKRQKITLRLHDRAIVFDSIAFEPGKKVLLSIDLDNLPVEARQVDLQGARFTSHEQSRYSPTIARFQVSRNSDYVYFTCDSTDYLVYHPCLNPGNSSTVLAGPLPQGFARYGGGVRYRHAGGYSYRFEDNIVYREPGNVLPANLQLMTRNDFRNLNDFYLSPRVTKEKVDNCRDANFKWYPTSINISQQNISFNVDLPVERDSTGVSNLLFQQVDSGKILFPDKMEYGRRKFEQMPNGTYNVIVLYNSGKYLKMDSILLQPYSYVKLNMRAAEPHAKDSLSTKWLRLGVHSAMIADRTLTNSHSDIEPYLVRSLFVSPARGVTGNVRGYVYDTAGDPVIGVSVIVKGTNNGTVTDIDGYFSLQIEEGTNTVLQFSYIGFKTKEVTVNRQTDLTVVMEEDSQMLEEVVVVGYGTQRMSALTGSVSSVSAAQTAPPAEEIEEDEDSTTSKEAEENLYNELLMLSGLRRNFSDVGFWEPRLYTDRKGQAEFTVTFPDNITKWETVVYAMNRRLMTGTVRKSIRSFKPLMGELKLPQFITEGDSSHFTGNIRNYTNDEYIRGNVAFALQGDTLMRKPVELKNSHTDKMLVTVPAQADSLTATYLFTRDDGYMDGEERTIPVVPMGTELAKGSLGFLRNGESISFDTEGNEELQISITGKQLDVYLEVAGYLLNYKYACNEQLASKLIGLLNYKLYYRYAGREFKYDKDINRIIDRLLANQNSERLWSWWGQSNNTSYWMSAHILRALKMAQAVGYDVPLNVERVESNYKHLIPYRRMQLSDIEVLHSLSQLGMNEDYAPAVDSLQGLVRSYEMHEDSLARKIKFYHPRSYLKEKMMLWEIQQQQGIASVTDSVSKYLKKNVLGNVFCSDGKAERYWYSDKLQSTLIAYRIAKRDSALVHHKEPMQMYILASKQLGWNTYQASSALATILPDLLGESSTLDNPATLLLTGRDNETVTRFPYQTTLRPGQHLNVEKVNGMPLIYSAYSLKRVTEENISEAFEIQTTLDNDALTAGQPVQLTVTVKVKQSNAEYVMIEVPIPAGCSYASKRNYSYYYGVETHREHFKERTVIFCERMPEGEYKFTIDLLPRYTGSYVLNPAKAELMYMPVVNGNNGVRKVVISD